MVHSVCIGALSFALNLSLTVVVSTRVCREGGDVCLDATKRKPISQVSTTKICATCADAYFEVQIM